MGATFGGLPAVCFFTGYNIHYMKIEKIFELTLKLTFTDTI